jgi:hypothetical protein
MPPVTWFSSSFPGGYLARFSSFLPNPLVSRVNPQHADLDREVLALHVGRADVLWVEL